MTSEIRLYELIKYVFSIEWDRSLTGRTDRQASGKKTEPGSLFVRLRQPVRETTTLTLDGVQMGIKPQLASVTLLCGLFGKHAKRGMNSLADPLHELRGRAVQQVPEVTQFSRFIHISTLLYWAVFSYLQSSLCRKATVGYSQGQTGWWGGCLWSVTPTHEQAAVPPGLPLLTRPFPWSPTPGQEAGGREGEVTVEGRGEGEVGGVAVTAVGMWHSLAGYNCSRGSSSRSSAPCWS